MHSEDATSIREIMRRCADAWLHNDWDAATAVWADDIVHHVPGRHRLAGD